MTLTGGVKNAMVAVTRYISNNFSDSERQISMNNFLGVVEPVREQIVEAFSVEEIPDEANMPISAASPTPTFVCLCVLSDEAVTKKGVQETNKSLILELDCN